MGSEMCIRDRRGFDGQEQKQFYAFLARAYANLSEEDEDRE